MALDLPRRRESMRVPDPNQQQENWGKSGRHTGKKKHHLAKSSTPREHRMSNNGCLIQTDVCILAFALNEQSTKRIVVFERL